MNLHYSRKFKNIGKRLCIMALAVMMVGTIISAAIPAVNAADYECGLEAHTHTDECYELTCTTPVGEQYGAHAHGEDCFTQVLACECAEGVEHTAECYTSEKVCTLEEGDNVLLSNHTHADACFNTICPKTEHTHTEECEAAVPAPLADDVGTMQITFTTDKPVGSALSGLSVTAGDDIYIDWGDGNIVLFDSTGTTKGSTVKIYSAGDITAFNCTNADITSLDLSGCTGLAELDCSGNKLQFSTLKLPATTPSTMTLSPQAPIEIPAETGYLVGIVDLSSEFKIDGSSTTYKWYNADGRQVYPFSANSSGGKFNFNFSMYVFDQSIYCEMTNSAFPGMTLTTTETKITDNMELQATITTNKPVGSELNISLFFEDGTYILVDWGDGTLTPYGGIRHQSDGYFPSGTVIGDTIKIYSPIALLTLMAPRCGITDLEFTEHSYIEELFLGYNDLTMESIHIPYGTSQLNTLDMSGNDISSIDLSTMPNLQMLFLNDTNLSTIDISHTPNLMALCCDNTGITSLDLANMQPGGIVSFENTNVSDLNLPSGYVAMFFNGDNAALMFSDLPDPALMDSAAGPIPEEQVPQYIEALEQQLGIKLNMTKFFEYAPQAKVKIADEIDSDDVIDLSSEYEVYGKNTVYKWFDGTTEVTPTTSEGGKFTFGSEFAGKKLRCEMTNENYPDLTLETTEVQVKVPYDKIKITVSGDIEWNNVPSGEDAPEVTVNLMLDGGVVDSVIVPSGTTEYSFADVSKFTSDGTELAYTVELDEIPENYEVSYGTPAADADGNITIDITGTYEEPITYGELTISNTVSGEDAPADAEFVYTVTFDSTESYPYTGSAAGTIKSGDKITLKNGESITIANIPVGVKFDVTQDEAENFVTSPSTRKIEGVISATPSVAAFSNAYNPPVVTGNLTITNKVTGENADTSLKFSFKVEFDAEGSYELRIYGAGETIPANATGMLGGMSITAAAGSRATVTTIKSGDTIQLAHGETAIIYGLPSGTTYKVTETENKAYKLTSTGASGTVSQDGAKASFINEKIKSSGGTNVPDTGDYGTSETVALYVMQIAMMAMLMCVYSMKKLKKQNESEQF